jgi:hypothetical protein
MMRLFLIVSFLLLPWATVRAATLHWTDTSSGTNQEDEFEIESAPASDGPWTPMATSPQDTTSYPFTTGNPGSTTWYRLRGVNAIGNGPYSEPVSFTVAMPMRGGVGKVQSTGNVSFR